MRNIVLAAMFMVVGAVPSGAQTLDQQERCSQAARRTFQEIEARDRAEQKSLGMSRFSSDYKSHHNKKLDKCLMLVEVHDQISSEFSTTAYVMDANERRLYAMYSWVSRSGKKYWEVPPTTCELTPNMTSKKTCATREEFDAFVAGYMEE